MDYSPWQKLSGASAIDLLSKRMGRESKRGLSLSLGSRPNVARYPARYSRGHLAPFGSTGRRRFRGPQRHPASTRFSMALAMPGSPHSKKVRTSQRLELSRWCCTLRLVCPGFSSDRPLCSRTFSGTGSAPAQYAASTSAVVRTLPRRSGRH